MIKEKLYQVDDELKNDIYATRRKIQAYNTAITREEIRDVAKDLFGFFGENSTVLPPFRCDYGKNIYIGERVFINYNTSMIDVAKITIGKQVLIGPDCGFYTAGHPIDKEIRSTGVEFGEAINIEDDVWLGGNVTVIGGVTIGAGSIIGAGSVVTKDIPKDVIAAGNPCRVIRKISQEDRDYWQDQYKKYLEEIS